MQHSIIINTKNSPTPLGPYAQAIRTKNMIFISGQIGICPDTGKITDDIYDQTQQVLKNIKHIIENTKLTIKNIVKTTIFVTNINELSIINTSYKNFFNTYACCNNIYFPARSCVEVSKLPKNAKIEIEAIAIIHD